MGNTGNIFPGTGANDAGIGATGWTTPENIVSDNGSDATCAAAASSQYLVAKNFNFGPLPSNATIKGVLVRVEASEHSGGTEPLLAQLQDASGALFGSSKSASNEGNISGTTKAVYTYGSTSDLWGAALTPAIVNDADFGVRLWFTTAHDIRIDFVTMQIQYQYESSLSDSVTSSDAQVKSATANKSDTVTSSDSTAKSTVLIKSDSSSSTDSISNRPTLNKSDSVSLSDAISNAIGLNKEDSVTASDLASSISEFNRLLTDGVTLSDLASNTIGVNVIDSVSTVDAIVKAAVKTLTDIVSVADQITPSLGGGGSDFTLDLSDEVLSADLVTKSTGKYLSDAGISSDQIFNLFGKKLSDGISLSDIISKGISVVRSDSVTAVDEFERTVDLVLRSLITESIALGSGVRNVTVESKIKNQEVLSSVI